MEGGSGVEEAERWLAIAEKLLAARDLHGTRTFALRARESDPRYEGSSQILAIADTLIAAESPVNGHPDWYAVLQLVRSTPDRDLIAAQHRKLTNLLNPVRNKLAFADLALKFVGEAWSVLFDPVKKSIYDDELRLIQLGEFPPNQPPPPGEGPIPVDSTKPASEIRSSRNEIRPNRPEGESFWTACPYCYVLFEYPKVYEECTLRCQNCRRAFHAAVISPPPAADGEDSYFCSWGFFPLGVSGNAKATGGSCNWSPISPIFACPPPKRGRGRPRKNPRPDPPKPDVLIEIPESSDDDFVDVDDDDDDDDDDYDEEDDHDDAEWEFGNKRKKDKNGKAKRKGLVGRPPKNAHKKGEEIS